MIRIGLDIGSTTIKSVVLDEDGQIIDQVYERHYSRISEKAIKLIKYLKDRLPNENDVSLCISGSAGMGLAEGLGVHFVQEVYATRSAVKTLYPETDAVIELGGEDAKVLFLKDSLQVRMNGSCAGGTGAFIDQMAALLGISVDDMNAFAARATKKYPIASRCGVFAKSDIQPLINQGARKEDICASIFDAVVNQTITGLSQGCKIEGKVLYLGGPLTFMDQLCIQFNESLNLKGLRPDYSLYYVAYGAAIDAGATPINLSSFIRKLRDFSFRTGYKSSEALFQSKEEYEVFQKRHPKLSGDSPIVKTPEESFKDSPKAAYIGIDAGSTTLKACVINEEEEIIYSRYLPNSKSPVVLVREFLQDVYHHFGEDLLIKGAASTGYGEEIIHQAFRLDTGVVETIAHFKAARKYNPNVDFIIDIGGQDIKCFKIRNQSIDNLFLNEACSSGCGSFLQSFAEALGENVEEFAQRGLFGANPVDLGSRCTVFMNSSVKQAQKDGASIENISAGLSKSVVKNALYKVIRVASAQSLGDHIVVQGGTFLNDAVLRAFEMEIGKEVTRPSVSGLMGAYGAALHAKELGLEKSRIRSLKELDNFSPKSRNIYCKGCTNHCQLTVHDFGKDEKYISGNQCEKGLGKKESGPVYNLYEEKRKLLSEYKSFRTDKPTIALPMGLNMWELLPFWHTFFKELGFGIEVTPLNSKGLQKIAADTIPSDTICYPAKLVHGHIRCLEKTDCDLIFYPNMTYNLDEKLSDNHFNCPVVAYYPEVIGSNMDLEKPILSDYIGLHHKRTFLSRIYQILKVHFKDLKRSQIRRAANLAYDAYYQYMEKIQKTAEDYLAVANEEHLPVIVLASRPYHLDPEISHGIDRFITEQGAIVVTEDSLVPHYTRHKAAVLNQWTYHARLYEAARFVASQKDMDINLIQLVSFGCGIDAVTTDEVRRILEDKNKIYTQIKIDEITNLGAVKIRIRSLFAADQERRANARK